MPDIGVEIDEEDEGDYTTVVGLAIARLGHLPTGPGEVVTLDHHTAEIVEIAGRAITRLRLRPVPASQPSQEARVGAER